MQGVPKLRTKGTDLHTKCSHYSHQVFLKSAQKENAYSENQHVTKSHKYI